MASAAATTAKIEAPEKTLANPQSTEAAKTSSPEDNLPVTATKSATEAPPSSPGAAGKTEADGGAPVTDTLKKMKRAERFNVPVQLSEQEKRSSRAERFGTGTGSQGSEALKKSEDLKKRARAERFGITPATASTDDDAKKKSRLARFTPAASKPDSEEEEKRKARALRFSLSASSTKDNTNGKGNTETKAAVLSTPGDGQ